MDTELPLSQYIVKSQKITSSNFEKKFKVAFLSSFTINGLAETLKVKCFERKIELIYHVGGYNQYNQEILNPNSDLYKFSADLVFLILDTRSIFGDIFHFPYSISKIKRQNLVKEKIDDLTNLIKTFQKNSNAKIIISNLSLTYYSPNGIAETKTDYGFHDMIMDFNKQIKEQFLKIENATIYDFFKFVVKHGEKNVFNFQHFLSGDIKIALDHIPYLANDLMQYVISSLALSKKCIVLDLDNTLWGGVVGEDGFDGITLGPQPPGNAFLEFQKTLKALTYRGILLAINSKNNFEDAIKVIREHPHMILKENDFVCMRINWQDKATNMNEISKELNLGTDSFVFLDDDPVNRELIRQEFPEIFTPEIPKDPSTYSEFLQSMIEFSSYQVTDEDKKRNQMYFEQRNRTDLKKASPNLEDFLKKLDLKIIIKKSDNFSIPRISQLSMKTNQFNLTTKRYQEQDIEEFSSNNTMIVGCAQIKDKFGDNGITGVFIIKKDSPKEWFLDTFLLSCRVMGRDIEKAILNYIIGEARKNKVSFIKAEYIPTNKNKPIENFLPESGFERKGNFWILDVNRTFNLPNFLTVIVE